MYNNAQQKQPAQKFKLMNPVFMREVEKAVLIKVLYDAYNLSNQQKDVWLPKSQCEIIRHPDGTFSDILITEWILKKKEEEIGSELNLADVKLRTSTT